MSTAAANIAWPAAGRGWYVTFVLAAAYFIAYVDRSIISLLIEPIKTDLSLSDTQIGLVTGFSFALFNGLAGIPLGRMADSSNRKWMIAVAVVSWSIMTAFCGLAKSFLTLFLARVGVGVGEAGLNPPALSMISDHFPPERRHYAVTTFVVGGSLGGGMALLLGAFILAFAEQLAHIPLPLFGAIAPWQWTFLIVAAPGVVIGLIVMLTIREPQRQGVDPEQREVPVSDVLAYYRGNIRAFTGLYLGLSLMFMVNMGYLVWGPTLFVRVHGMELTTAGALFGGSCFVAALIGNYVCAAMAKHHAKKGRLDGPLRAARLCMLIIIVPMCVGPLLPNPYLVNAVIAPAIGLMVGMSSLSAIAIQTMVPNRLRGLSLAIFALMVSLLAGGLSPLVIALLSDNVFGEQNLHYATAAMAIVILPIALALMHWGLPGYRRTAAEAQRMGVI